MDEIRQRKDEPLEEFVKRCLNEKNTSGKDYRLVFNNNVELTTEGYNILSPTELLESFTIKSSRIERENQVNKFITVSTDSSEDKQEVQQQEAIKIDNPLKFLLDATNKKYYSDETAQQIRKLQEQRNQLLDGKKRITERLMAEREIDFKTLSEQQGYAELRKSREVSQNQKAIDLESEQIRILEAYIAEQKGYIEELKRLNLEDSMEPSYAVQVKKEYRQKNIQTAEEYLQISENELNERLAKKEALLQRNKDINEDYQKFCRDLLARVKAKYGELTEENEKRVSKFENIPEIIKINDVLQDVETQLVRLQRNPEEIYNQILEMMHQKVEPTTVERELRLLASTISQPKIGGILEKDKDYYETTTQEIRRLQDEYVNLDQYINTNSYYKQKEMIADEEVIETLKKGIAMEEANEARYKAELQRFEEQKQIPRLQDSLKIIQQSIKTNEKLLRDCLDLEVQRTTDISNQQLKVQEQTLQSRIMELQKDGVIRSDKAIKKNLERAQKAIIEYKAEITRIEGKDYIDTEAKEMDMNQLHDIKVQIRDLEEQQRYLGIHTVEELLSIIMEDYVQYVQNSQFKKIIENANEGQSKLRTDTKIDSQVIESENSDISIEEIEATYEDANRNLLNIISNTDFIKQARRAMKNILQHITGSSIIPKRRRKEPSNSEENYFENNEREEQMEEIESIKAQEVEDDFSEINTMLESALQDYTSGIENKVLEENVKKGMQELKSYPDMLQYEWTQDDIGKLFVIKETGPERINYEDAENYIKKGKEVLLTYDTEEGTIGTIHLELSADNTKIR